jgi:hypothetical protein
MDILQESKDGSKKTFFNQFQPQKKSTAEILNSIQYAVLDLFP